MPDVSYEKLQAASQATYRLDFNRALQVATGINKDADGICYQLYGKPVSACFTELLGDGSLGSSGILMSHALLLDGTAGCWCSTPDAVALDLAADMDLRIEFTTTTGGGVNQCMIGKWDSRTNIKAYKIHTVFGLLSLRVSTTGADEVADFNTAVPAGTRSVRLTLDAVNGANHITEGFAAPSGLGLGTQFDTETVAGNLAIFNSTAALGIGGDDGGTIENFGGRILRAQVRSAIDGTIVANPDFRNLAPGTTNFVDSAGLTWTLHGTARIV